MASEAGKGDKRRQGDDKAFEAGHDAIFGNKPRVRGSFIWDSARGEMVDKNEYYANQPETSGGVIILDDIAPYKSMITGEMISSRSKHNAHLRQHNMVETANEQKYIAKRRENIQLEQKKQRREQIIDIVVNKKFQQGR
jgi:hypothetical protein